MVSPDGRTPLPTLSIPTVVMDYVTPLITMALCPPLRPISFTLMNSKERTLALEAIDFLAASGLTFAPITSAAAASNPYDVEYAMKP